MSRALAHQSWGPLRRHQHPITDAWACVTEGELQRERARTLCTRMQAKERIVAAKRHAMMDFAEASVVGLRRSMRDETKAALGQIAAIGTGRMK